MKDELSHKRKMDCILFSQQASVGEWLMQLDLNHAV